MGEVQVKKGISETLKVLRAIQENVVELVNINWSEVVEELKDADPIEVKDLVVEALSAIMQIIAALKLTAGPLGSIFKLLKLLKVI